MSRIFRKLFRKLKKKDLREVCRELYGDDFVALYDAVNSGIPIGGLRETIVFLEMVDAARKKIDGDGE